MRGEGDPKRAHFHDIARLPIAKFEWLPLGDNNRQRHGSTPSQDLPCKRNEIDLFAKWGIQPNGTGPLLAKVLNETFQDPLAELPMQFWSES